MLKSKCPTVSVTSGGEDSSCKTVAMIARDAKEVSVRIDKETSREYFKHHDFIKSVIYNLSFKTDDSSPRTSPQPHDFHVYTPHKFWTRLPLADQ